MTGEMPLTCHTKRDLLTTAGPLLTPGKDVQGRNLQCKAGRIMSLLAAGDASQDWVASADPCRQHPHMAFQRPHIEHDHPHVAHQHPQMAHQGHALCCFPVILLLSANTQTCSDPAGSQVSSYQLGGGEDGNDLLVSKYTCDKSCGVTTSLWLTSNQQTSRAYCDRLDVDCSRTIFASKTFW